MPSRQTQPHNVMAIEATFHTGSRRKLLFFGSILLVIVAASVTLWYFYPQLRNSSKHQPKTNSTASSSNKATSANSSTTSSSQDQEVAAANTFLKSKVGDANFAKLYKAAPDHNVFTNLQDSTYDFVAYHFKPIRDYNLSGRSSDPNADLILLQVNRNNLKDITTDYAPDCVKDTNQCNFATNRVQAADIAQKSGLKDTSQIYIVKGSPLRIAVTDCSLKKEVIIDYTSGKIVKTQANDSCSTPLQ